MSNNPGKKGKPAPWERRKREHYDRALQAYRLENHPAYRKWSEERSEVARKARVEAELIFPGLLGISRAIKYTDKAVRAWDKKNKNPLTWEQSEALKADFSKVYVPVDLS